MEINNILTEEQLLNICLDNIVANLGSSDDCFKYVTAYAMTKNPELDDSEIPQKVHDMIADKILSNLVTKDMVEYDWETETYKINPTGMKYFEENLIDKAIDKKC